MSKTIQIRWHSRAGQGAITAANALAHIAISAGLSGQSFPEFGAEKRGAPVRVFNRISDQKIKITTEIEHPDIVVLLDTTLVNHEISYADVLEGLGGDGILIINTEQVSSKFNKLFTGKIYHVPASKLALDNLKRDMPNVPILAAVLKITDLVDYDRAEHQVQKLLEGKLSEAVVTANLKAFKAAYEQT